MSLYAAAKRAHADTGIPFSPADELAMERRAGEMRALLAPDAAERAAAFGASLALDLAFGAGRHTVLE